jgi:hypothetical protein
MRSIYFSASNTEQGAKRLYSRHSGPLACSRFAPGAVLLAGYPEGKLRKGNLEIRHA